MAEPLPFPTDTEPTAAELVAARPHLRYDALDGLLVEDVPLNAIADGLGTPTWVLSAGALRGRLARLQGALAPGWRRGSITRSRPTITLPSCG